MLLPIGLTLLAVGVWAWLYLQFAPTSTPPGMFVHNGAERPSRHPEDKSLHGYYLPLVPEIGAEFSGGVRVYCDSPIVEARVELESSKKPVELESPKKPVELESPKKPVIFGLRARGYGIFIPLDYFRWGKGLHIYVYGERRIRTLWVSFCPLARPPGKRRRCRWRR